ncbi:MAG TPA: bifunctional glutamate N-acetyltransferase/amino-acid acetyltransferase ArgJ [Armatimonadota bacterium]|nr:bifunctional glutamate N-acetyltransferase/amino-acid acetyltransferase ArgJ [Armatimonadota bacterium]
MAEINEIPGSVCAPIGFRAAGVAAGLKPSGNPDIALIVSDEAASAAGVFTTNRVCAAPVLLCREHLGNGKARAIAVNAGNANACTGEQGMRDARRMAGLTGELLGVSDTEVLVASTGIIGRPLPMERVEAGLRNAAGELSREGSADAARAIMTTDTRPKEIAVEVPLDGKVLRIGGICKGSGMIAPNMATMLAFITTDADVWPEVLQSAMQGAVERTFNCVTVDGDTSTNDTLLILANGASGVRVPPASPAHAAFCDALGYVCEYLAKELARDGEGATKLVEITVRGARSSAQARKVGLSIANSPLVKTALFGNDPNWGRILCAAGYSGVAFDQHRVALTLSGFPLVRNGEPVPFDEAAVSTAMKAAEVPIVLDLGQAGQSATVWTCDFSYDYVRINAEYTT